MVILRNVIKKFDYFNARFYMRCYCWYLKKIGIRLNGVPRFIHPSVIFDGKGYNLTYIGENAVISRNVLLLNHDYSITCGLRAVGDKIEKEAYWLKEIKIGNNVFIGANCTILPGTVIADNCIVGAGSVIRGKVESNSIVCGNPAKKIGELSEWTFEKKRKNNYMFEDRNF